MSAPERDLQHPSPALLTLLIPVIYDGESDAVNWFHRRDISTRHLHADINKGHDSQSYKYAGEMVLNRDNPPVQPGKHR